MVHCEHGIGMVKILRLEKGIGRQRPAQIHPFCTQLFQHRNNGVYLFRTHMPTFPRMWVQAADQHVRFGKTKLVLQVVVQDGDNLPQQVRRDGIAHRFQRQVGRCQRDAQLLGCQHHHHFRCASALFKELGVPGKGDAGIINDAFVDRAGDQCGKLTVQAAIAGAGERFNNIATVLNVERSRRNLGMQGDG